MHSEDTVMHVTHADVNMKARQNKEVDKYKRKYKTDINGDRRQGKVINTQE
jgi:hypothetical protein